MGTNYYLKYRDQEEPKEQCLFPEANNHRLHIGKSSSGWAFALHVIPELGINGLTDWMARFLEPNAHILDEYGSELQPYEMMEVIQNRNALDSSPREDTWLARNFAVMDSRGLVRYKISQESYCLGHGEGPWDLILGDFS